MITPKNFHFSARPIIGREAGGSVRTLRNHVSITVDLGGDTDLCLRFVPGYQSDLGSIPRGFRGLVDGDYQGLGIPTIVHDALFGSQFLPFSDANALFLWMLRQMRAPAIRAALAFLAASSCAGLRAYQSHPPIYLTDGVCQGPGYAIYTCKRRLASAGGTAAPVATC